MLVSASMAVRACSVSGIVLAVRIAVWLGAGEWEKENMNESTISKPVFFCNCRGTIRTIERDERDVENPNCRFCGQPMFIGHSVG